MRNINKSKRYFWLKLKDDFFNQKEIKMLRKIAGGDTFTIIYLKMLLLSLKNDGKIYFDGIADNFIEEIALDIDEDIDNTQVTFNYLQQKGLIEFETDNEIDMVNIASMIGSETDSAVRKRRQRKLEKKTERDNVTPMSQLGHTEIEIEKDIEIEIEKDKEKDSSRNHSEIGKIIDFYENNGYGTLSKNGLDTLTDFYQSHGTELVLHALKTADLQNSRNLNYVRGILRNWKNEDIKTISDVEARENKRVKENQSDDDDMTEDDYFERFGF